MKDAGYDVAVFPGDGTGPEVVREGLKVLGALAEGASVLQLDEIGDQRRP